MHAHSQQPDMLLRLNPSELGELRALLDATEDAGLDEHAFVLRFREQLLAAGLISDFRLPILDSNPKSEIQNQKSELPLVMLGQGDYVRCYGEPIPDRVTRLEKACLSL